ncbi:Ig-like domain (group 2) [Lachnospiraceae bacterium XBB1006]|nr:Ig-like domain (group 2) [Lachnospiraceae bacterium XBB1006]
MRVDWRKKIKKITAVAMTCCMVIGCFSMVPEKKAQAAGDNRLLGELFETNMNTSTGILTINSEADLQLLANYVNDETKDDQGNSTLLGAKLEEIRQAAEQAARSSSSDWDSLSDAAKKQKIDAEYANRVGSPNRSLSGVTVKLGTSIALNGSSYLPIAKKTAFEGTFDGDNKTISGLSLMNVDTDAGLFGVAGNGAKFQNVTVSGTITSQKGDVGLLLAKSEAGEVSFDNITVSSGEVSTDQGNAGMIAGNVNGTFSNCRIDTGAVVNANAGSAGLIVGTVRSSGNAFKDCTVSGSIGGGSVADTLAGLLGGEITGNIQNVDATGMVTISKGSAGMLAGKLSGSYEGSNKKAANVSISVEDGKAGIFVGELVSGTLSNCESEATCNVTIQDGKAGGVAGSASGTISNCKIGGTVTGKTNGSHYLGGIVGESYGTHSVSGNTFQGNVNGLSTNSVVGGAVGINMGTLSVSNFKNDNAPGSSGVLGGIIGENRGNCSLDKTDNNKALGTDGNLPNIVGGLIGRYSGGTMNQDALNDSHNKASLRANKVVGDIIGEATGGSVNLNKYETEAVSLIAETEGGFVGSVKDSADVRLTNCKRKGTLGSYVGNDDVKGGFIGAVNGGTVKIKNLENEKEITSNNAGSIVGGIIGKVEGTPSIEIATCKNFVDLKASHYAGGMIGRVLGGDIIITDCQAKGNVDAEIVGGMVGEISLANATIKSCLYDDKKVAGVTTKYSLKASQCAGGIVGSLSKVNTVKITDCHFKGIIDKAVYVGGIVGSNEDGTSIEISDCDSKYPDIEGKDTDFHLNGTYVGGILGKTNKKSSVVNTKLAVQGCTNERSVVGETGVALTGGGIVGEITYDNKPSAAYATISKCENLGEVRGIINGVQSEEIAKEDSGVYKIGGICGVCKGGLVEKCHNDGAISGGFGMVGTLDELSELRNSYNTGQAQLGGLVGIVRKGNLYYCYTIGKVPTKREIIGAISDGFTVKSCYYWKQYDGYQLEAPMTFAHGVPWSNFQDETKSLSKKEFGKKASFKDWDFDKIWVMKQDVRDIDPRPVLLGVGSESTKPNAEGEAEDDQTEEKVDEANKETYKATLTMPDWVYGAPNASGWTLTPGYADKGYKQIIVQYKKLSESASAYTADRPTEVGSYQVRVMLQDSNKYKDTDWFGPATFQIKEQDKGNTIVGYPLPVSNQKTATISSAMGNGIVEMDEITDTFLNRIVGTSTSYDSIKIDASKATGAVRQLVLSRLSMEEFFKMMELRPYITNLKVDFYKGQVTIPYEKAKSVVAETAGSRLTIELWERARESLTTEQMNAILNMQVVTVLNPRVTSNNEQVSIRDVKVTYPYTLPGSKVIDDYAVYGLDVDGSMQEYPFTYSGGQFTFTAGYEGLYVIALREDTRVNLPTSTAINEDFTVRHLGNRLKIGWGKVADATFYEIFVKKAGSKFDYTKVTATSKEGNTYLLKKLSGKSINNKTSYKVRVIACKRVNGNRVRLGKSMIGYVVGTRNKKYTNTTLVTVRRTICFLNQGDTWSIGAKAVLVNKKKKLVPGYTSKFRYKSDDTTVASVSGSGKVTAKNPGTCCIYVYAKNGLTRKVKITVE